MKNYYHFLLATFAFFSLTGENTYKKDINLDDYKFINTIDNKFNAKFPLQDTVTAFNKSLDSGTYVFKTRLGNYFVFDVSNEADSISNEIEIDSIGAMLDGKKNKECEGPKFDGSYRKIVKTTPSKKKLEKNLNPKNLFSDLIRLEEVMCDNKAQLKEDKRKVEEDRNVQFKEVFIYTFRRQRDEDYHVIFGTTSDVKTALFFNGEISGTSNRTSHGHNLLNAARKDFEEYFGIGDSCANSYYKKDFRRSPFPVKLTGSLFFDGQHCSNFTRTGPQNWTNVKLQSAWEIHPITHIKFLK